MKVERITTNHGNYKNQPSHKAVNLRFLKKAIDEYNRYYPHHNQGHLIDTIDNCICYGLISKQDAIDTLNAIKPYAQNALHAIEETLKVLKEIPSNQ